MSRRRGGVGKVLPTTPLAICLSRGHKVSLCRSAYLFSRFLWLLKGVRHLPEEGRLYYSDRTPHED